LSSGPQEIRALDGLRAVAALNVLVYHAIRAITHQVSVFGLDLTFAWYYTQTGVHLFFVLSGFLLFLPFARAMLLGRPLPSARQFYQRRALRILPAYYVCLAILVLLGLPAFLSATGLANIGTHVVLLHDDFPDFNRSIEGPFWTLAVEAQFYLVLPPIAWAIARIVGATHSVGRLCGGVLGMIAAALLLREVDAAGYARLDSTHGVAGKALAFLLRVTLGWQGKFLEVFAIGMLCAVLYVAASEGRLAAMLPTRKTAAALVVMSAMLWFVLGHVALQYHIEVPPYFNLEDPRDLKQVLGPFGVGLGYGALLLAVLWGGRIIRAIFEWAPLRFVGLISYSLYLWHEPIVVNLLAPHVLQLPANIQVGVSLAAGLIAGMTVAYLSYQFVERPFLKKRRRTTQSAATQATPAGQQDTVAGARPLSGASAGVGD
jgi:peptidoglycan/LPS O-acetylase OafA/YrhL